MTQTFKTGLILPTISINGTSRESLVADLVQIIRALRAVEEAMGHGMPHGRDYQNSRIDGENMSYPARDAYNERRMVINDMKKEFERHAECIATVNRVNPATMGTRHIGVKAIPIIGMLQPGYEVLMRRDLEPEAGKVSAEIVLCYLPDNANTPLVTWQRNTKEFSAPYRGHYYTADDFDEAVRDFNTRVGGVKEVSNLRTQHEADNTWSVYQGGGFRTGGFKDETEAERWINKNGADYIAA